VDDCSIFPLLLPVYSREGHETPEIGRPVTMGPMADLRIFITREAFVRSARNSQDFWASNIAYNSTKSDKIRFIGFREIHHIPNNFDHLYLGNEQRPRIFFKTRQYSKRTMFKKIKNTFDEPIL
jgi:hypothetical protein